MDNPPTGAACVSTLAGIEQPVWLALLALLLLFGLLGRVHRDSAALMALCGTDYSPVLAGLPCAPDGLPEQVTNTREAIRWMNCWRSSCAMCSG